MVQCPRCIKHRATTQGRRKAVLFRHALAIGFLAPLGLAGCSQGGGLSPMGETVLGFWQSPDLTAQADSLPYASLVVKTEGNEALMVMAHGTGEEGRDTFWQAGDYATLHLRDGIPMSTMGFEQTLLGRWVETEPGSEHYLVHAHWQDGAGQEYQDVATATLTCETARSTDLPLTVLTLERCIERLEWQDGARSKGELWREPGSWRIWGGDLSLWPGGQRVEWQVARPWWSTQAPSPETSN
jgi:hypothetical protein